MSQTAQKTRVGQIGVGTWGKNHCLLLADMPEVDFVGVHDVYPERCGRCLEQTSATEFADLDRLLSAVEAVVITAATPRHFEFATRALRGGRHVFLEKPMCATSAEASELAELAGSTNLVLQIGHIERFNPAFRAVQACQPAPRQIEVRRMAPPSPRNSEVSVVLDLMIHDLDLVRTLIASEPVEVRAHGVSAYSSSLDHVTAQLVFANGCVAYLTASRMALRKERTMCIYAPEAQYHLDFITRHASRRSHPETDGIPLVSADAAASSNALLDELRSFLAAIRNSRQPEVDGFEGLAALALAEQIEREIRTP